ncbi:MAG TPA: hypothetical protein VFW40_06660 [Capsulimonadaceae bacterium]|nr:hypothetical protein [Capsulimonadaceae bacterium]
MAAGPISQWSYKSQTFCLALLGLAIGGSLLYGASLSLVFPHQAAVGASLWLALSAGLSWCIFLPALVIVAKRPIPACVAICLVTMAVGEAFLVAGALGNLLLAYVPVVSPITFNCSCVGLANATMAVAMTRQMAVLRVPAWKTLLLWLVVLDGAGALFFYLLRFLLEARPW